MSGDSVWRRIAARASIRSRYRALFALLWVMLSCGDGGPTGPAPIGSIVVTPGTLTLASGASATLSAAVLDAKGTALTGRLLVWNTSDPSVATVTPAGVLTAAPNRGATPLTTTVSAQSEGKVGQATVTVTPAPAARIALTPDSVALAVGATMSLTVAVEDASGATLTGRTVTYASLDTTVARVSSTGQVTAASYGGPDTRTTRIVASAEGRADTTRVVVTPLAVASVTASLDSISLLPGGTRVLTVVARDAAGTPLTGRSFTWSSTDSSVVTGAATGPSTGDITAAFYAGPLTRSALVVVTSAGKADVVVVTVAPLPVGRVTATPDSLTLLPSGTATLTALVTDSTGRPLSGRSVTWSATDTTIGTITPGGVVVARAYEGPLTRTTRFIVASGSARDTASLTVLPIPVTSVSITGAPADSVLLLGGTLTLSATMRSAAGATLQGRAVTWSTSASAVATVSTAGVVTPVTAGTVVVSATSEGRTASTTVLVRAPVTVPPAGATSPVTTTVLGGAVALTVPPGATTAPTLTVAPAPVAPTDDRVLSGSAYVFGPPGTTFATPVTIALRFDPLTVPVAKREKLRIALVTDTALVEVAGGQVDLATSRVSVAVAHFSTYSIVVPPDPAALEVLAGANQEAEADAPVPITPVVRVVDARGRSISRERVRVTVTTGGGQLADTSAVATDAQGRAALPVWTLGPTVGEQTLTVTVLGSPVTRIITVVARPSPVATVQVSPASATIAEGGTQALTVTVRNAPGSVLPGRTVTWTSSDTTIATVSSAGLVTARAFSGAATRTATITATVEGRSGSATITVTPRPVAAVAVSPTTATIVAGGTQQLAATVTDASAGVLQGRTVTWTSSDTTVATVSSAGLVTARAYSGAATRTATIRATVEGRSGSATITVTPRPVAAVSVSPTAATIGVGGSQQLTATATDASAGVLTGRTVTWRSSDTTVVTVTASGLATARAYAGAATRTATITATVEGRSGSATITVSPVSVAAVAVSPAAATIVAGGTRQLTATVTDASAGVLVGRTVAWTSSDTTIVTVAASGLVTARAYAGTATRTATVTATVEGRSASATITVSPLSVSLVAVNLTVATIPVGGEQVLSATTRDALGMTLTDRQVAWASSDTAVASVAATGLTTALVTARPYAGPAIRVVTITASRDAGSGTAQISVTPLPVAALEVSPATPTVVVGGTQTLSAITRDATGVTLTGRTIVWSSSDTTIAVVASTGAVTAKPYLGAATRTVTISATAEGKTGSAVLSITPAPVASVAVTPATATVSVGGSQQLTATPKDASGAPLADRPVTWTSSDTTVAQVSMERIVTAVPYLGGATRTATITATSGGQSGSMVLTVRPIPVASVTVNPSTATLAVGDTARLVAVPYSASQQLLTGRGVTWTSSNTSVATVSGSGLVTSVAAGSAIITATSEGRSGTAVVTVSGAGIATIPGVEFRFVVPDGQGGYFAGGALTAATTIAGQSFAPVGSDENGMVVRFSPNLQPVWVVRTTGPLTALAGGLGQTVTAAVIHRSTLRVDAVGSSPTFTSAGGWDGLAVTLDASGAISQWTRLSGGSANDDFYALTVDASGSVYLAGKLNGCCTSTGQATLSTSTGQSATLPAIGFATAFIAKVSAGGTIGWVSRYGGRDAMVTALAVDSQSGRVYAFVLGPRQTSWTLVDGVGSSTSGSCPSTDCPFIAAFSSSTGALLWRGSFAFAGGGSVSGLDMAVQPVSSDLVVLATCFGGAVTVSSTASPTTVGATACGGTNESRQRIVLRFSATGIPRAAVPVVSSSGFSTWFGGISASSDEIRVASPFAGTLTAGASSLTANGAEEGVVLRMSQDLAVTSAIRLNGPVGSVNRLLDVRFSETGGWILVGMGVTDASLGGLGALTGSGGFIVTIP